MAKQDNSPQVPWVGRWIGGRACVAQTVAADLPSPRAPSTNKKLILWRISACGLRLSPGSHVPCFFRDPRPATRARPQLRGLVLQGLVLAKEGQDLGSHGRRSDEVGLPAHNSDVFN